MFHWTKVALLSVIAGIVLRLWLHAMLNCGWQCTPCLAGRRPWPVQPGVWRCGLPLLFHTGERVSCHVLLQAGASVFPVMNTSTNESPDQLFCRYSFLQLDILHTVVH
jgi:hypothetical protein